MTIENLLAWSAQMLALALVGTLLPVLCRIRDPRSLLRYFQALLLLCVLLPAIQPWRRELIIAPLGELRAAGPVVNATTPSASAGISWEEIALVVFLSGAALRLLWLIAGMARLSKHRRDARPLYPLPPSVEAARDSVGADALVCLAGDQTGPVTFGSRVPVILLPERFLLLPSEAQFAIACHELLHVRRRDWLQHMIEEAVSIVLWFHPAAWWLVSRIRLSREQAVDREVVRLTQARDPYVQALLTMSGTRPSLDLAPAPLFLRQRHLKERIYSIVKEVTMSKRRLVTSYASMSAVLAGATWMAVALFPLQGLPQVQTDPLEQKRQAIAKLEKAIAVRASADAPGIKVSPGGTVLHRPGVLYPIEARRARVTGTVTLEASLDQQGNVIDARVISGPDQLRRAALAAILQWHYAKDTTPDRVQATIEFQLPANSPPGPPPPPPPPPNVGRLLSVNLAGLPDSLAATLRSRLDGFVGQRLNEAVMTEIRTAILDIEPHARIAWRNDSATRPEDLMDLHLHIAVGEVSNAAFADTAPPADFGAPPAGTQRIRVGGNVQATKLTNQVNPEYPALARTARIQGTVRLAVLISPQGEITRMQLMSGHPLLVKNAQEAVGQWRYQPTLLNGNPVEVQTVIDVNYTLVE
jgi:protein TonB